MDATRPPAALCCRRRFLHRCVSAATAGQRCGCGTASAAALDAAQTRAVMRPHGLRGRATRSDSALRVSRGVLTPSQAFTPRPTTKILLQTTHSCSVAQASRRIGGASVARTQNNLVMPERTPPPAMPRVAPPPRSRAPPRRPRGAASVSSLVEAAPTAMTRPARTV